MDQLTNVSNIRRSSRVAVLVCLAAASSLDAQQPSAAAMKLLKWRSVGLANQAGRVSVVAGIPGDPYTYYVAGANGGIIKTTNGGTTFKPIFDDQDVGSI